MLRAPTYSMSSVLQNIPPAKFDGHDIVKKIKVRPRPSCIMFPSCKFDGNDIIKKIKVRPA
jgi:hypothetical protein